MSNFPPTRYMVEPVVKIVASSLSPEVFQLRALQVIDRALVKAFGAGNFVLEVPLPEAITG